MGSVYTRTFISVTGISGASSYTVPPGTVAIVAAADFYAGVSVLGTVARLIDNQTGGSFFFDQTTPESAGYMSWRGRQAFIEGESFAVASENGPLDARVTGYLFDL